MCATFFCESARHAYYMYKTIEEVFELSLSALELQQKYCTVHHLGKRAAALEKRHCTTRVGFADTAVDNS